MSMGASDIADLRLTKLQKLMERYTLPPSLLLMGLFGQDNWESDNIEWESAIGNRGLTPFVAPGAPAPQTSIEGIGKNAAMAAFWKEKQWFDEVFLNNLRQPGTLDRYMPAKKRLAKELRKLKNRCDRRKEWMFAKMLTAGSLTYKAYGGLKLSLNYGIPSDNQETLAANRKWDDGADRNVLEDILDARLTLRNACGAEIDYALFTSEILNILIKDTSIQTLLSKSAYGNGDLFARPREVLGNLLNIPNMVVYDEQYQIRAWLTAAVTGGSTTAVSVDETADFEVGGTLRFYDVSAKSWEDETISAVSDTGGTVTVSSAPTASFKAGEDYVAMTKKFLPTDKFIMFASQLDGEKIAEFANAPFGLNRQWGMKVDQNEEWDPEGLFIRVQNKGLPVLYQEDAVYIMTVT